MNPDRGGVDASDVRVEAALRRHYLGIAPGPVPVGLLAAIDRIPGAIERSRGLTLGRLVMPAMGLAAAVSVLALAVMLLGTSQPGPSVGATPHPSAVPFDPTLAGPGLAEPVSGAGQWFLVLVGAASLLGLGFWVGLQGRRRVVALLPAAGAVALLAYAAYGEYAPIDVHVTAWGPRLNMAEAAMPTGASENLFYVTAGPNEPFAFGILLIGGTDPTVRVEGMVENPPWTAVWLDDEPHGGMSSPARPFEPFTMPRDGRAIYLVGRASPCALGRAPVGDENLGSYGYDMVRLNVSVLGWPRVVQLEIPNIVEPITDLCEGWAAVSPTASPSH